MCNLSKTVFGSECRRSRCCGLAALVVVAVLSARALATDAPPTVDVLSVRLVSAGLTEQQLKTVLCVTNPNTNELGFRRVTVSLDVSGLPFASGVSDSPIRLPPLSSTAVPFTVSTTTQNIGPQLLGLLQSGSLPYRISGTVSLDGVLGLTLPFSRSGHLDLLRAALRWQAPPRMRHYANAWQRARKLRDSRSQPAY